MGFLHILEEFWGGAKRRRISGMPPVPGLDTNGDGMHNPLAIYVRLDPAAPGNYAIMGPLAQNDTLDTWREDLPECCISKCESGDLNPDPFRDWILSPARLPIPPLSQEGDYR